MPKRVSPRRRDTHGAGRPTARRDAIDAKHSLARLLDSPLLERVVPHLPAEALHQLVRHHGLDACGALLTAATPAQLTSLFDLDLWRPAQPGRDERFDDDRFGEWIEQLVDAGQSTAARVVAAIDSRRVVAGLSRYVRVFDPAAVTAAPHDDGSPAGDAFDADAEVGGYLLVARRTDAWDAIVALLAGLDACHPECFHAVMQGCRRLSNSMPEVDGLDSLLTAPEQQEHDAAAARERRQSQLGYASPADARAFLEMARRPQRQALGAHGFAAASLRAAEAAASRASNDARAGEHAGDAAAADVVRESLDAFAELLSEMGEPSGPRRALLAGGETAAREVTRLQRLMAQLAGADEIAFVARSQELAFLANTLVAGCPLQSRPFTAREASDAAMGLCNLGLEYWPGRWPGPEEIAADGTPMPAAFLVDHDLVTAFHAGWRTLYEDVTRFAAEALQAVLADVECADADIEHGLRVLRRELGRECGRGTPWRAADALDVLSMLDMTVCVGLRGLLAECPVLPAAVTAIVGGQTGPVSPTAFELFSGTGQIRQVRSFMTKVRTALVG